MILVSKESQVFLLHVHLLHSLLPPLKGPACLAKSKAFVKILQERSESSVEQSFESILHHFASLLSPSKSLCLLQKHRLVASFAHNDLAFNWNL